MGAFCPSCGNAISGGRFCEHCGTEQPRPQDVDQEVAADLGEEKSAAPPDADEPRRRLVVSLAPEEAAPPDPSKPRTRIVLPGSSRRRRAFALGAALAAGVIAGAIILLTQIGGGTSGTPPAGPEGRSSARFPVGTRIHGMAVTGDHAWVTTGGKRWAGLTRLDRRGARFSPLPGSHRDAFLGYVKPRHDGGAWIVLSPHSVALVHPDGSIRRIPLKEPLDSVQSQAMAVGAGDDFHVMAGVSRMLTVYSSGVTAWQRLDVPRARTSSACLYSAMAPARAGAFWIDDFGCARVLRVDRRGGVTASAAAFGSEGILGLSGGRVLLSGDGIDPRRGFFILREPSARTVRLSLPPGASGFPGELTSDGSGGAWSSLRYACGAAHVSGTHVTVVDTQFPAYRAAVDDAGGLWIAGNTRVARVNPKRRARMRCDLTPPKLRTLGLPRGNLSLDQLEHEGITMSVSEPSILAADLGFSDDATPGKYGAVRETRAVSGGQRTTIRISSSIIQRIRQQLEAGTRVFLTNNSNAEDVNGNRTESPAAPRKIALQL